MPNITTSIAGIKLQAPVYNASGAHCVTQEELSKLTTSDAGAVLTKSMTKDPREGNPEPRYYEFGQNSINSMGLPNKGYQYYMDCIPGLAQQGKPVFASVSGMTLDDTKHILSELQSTKGLSAIECNLSCPNLPGKPQIGYDFEATTNALNAFSDMLNIPWGVKLPPYFDEIHFQDIAKILNNSKTQFVTTINGLGNGLVIDRDKEQVAIKPKGGLGGVGGQVSKPFGLSNVYKLRQHLRKDISLVGVGGVLTGADIFDYVLVGADAVQTATGLMMHGPSVFTQLNSELQEIMEQKSYSSLEQFRGTIKAL